MYGVLIGAALVVAGMVVLANEALGGRPLSDAHRSRGGHPTLEPRGQRLAFLGLSRNWLGVVMIAIGSVMLVATA